jgi:hypothetical protein
VIKRLIVTTQVIVFGFALLGSGFAKPATAACAAPIVTVRPGRGAPGSGITVSGENFSPECNDTIACVVGQPCPTLAPNRPQRGITVQFVQREQTWTLATVDAQPDLTFSVATTVPSDAQRGPAEVVAAPAQPVKFEVGGPPQVVIDKQKQKLKQKNRISPGQLRKIRERLRERPDPADEDVWVAYVAAAGAIALVAFAGLMLRRRSNS